MIKYFKELENRDNFYLPLVNRYDDDNIEFLCEYAIPVSFIEKYADLFKCGNALIKRYEDFDMDKYLEDNPYFDYAQYEETWDSITDMDTIREELYPVMKDYNKINISSFDIECYISLIKKLSLIYIYLFSNSKEYYTALYNKAQEALNELKKYNRIELNNDGEYQYEPDAWFITPDNHLYNPGGEGHYSRDFKRQYNQIKKELSTNKKLYQNHCISNLYYEKTKKIEEDEYIYESDFMTFLNYYKMPLFLEQIDEMNISREKHIVTIIKGIVNAHAHYFKFMENLCIYTDNPSEELNKIDEMTSNDMRDFLVRCCGFHKVESMQDKTITTSCINYEQEFEEYIKRGWNIVFVPPIIIDEEEKCIKEYPQDFLTIRKVLKNMI